MRSNICKQAEYTCNLTSINKDGHTMFIDDVVKDLTALQRQLAEARAQIDAMKCCGNCGHEQPCELYDGIEGDEDCCDFWQLKKEVSE